VSGSEVLERYAEMLHLSQQMLASARKSEWDHLIELELKRAVLSEYLMKHEANCTWTTADQEKKGELIRSILEMDDEIKSLTQAWMGELQEILGSIGTEKKLHKAYESP